MTCKKGNSILLLFIVGIILETAFVLVVHPWVKNDSGKYDPTKTGAEFHGQTFLVPPEIQELALNSQVLGSSSHTSNGKKRIEVDLTNQKLYAYEGNKKVYSFLVSTGRWGRTPTGVFHIYYKLKYTLMTGGSKELGTYYYLPNVPYTMYFYQGYGLHGTYWHHNFGHPMSHGCVNMKTEDAETIFYWTSPSLPNNSNSVQTSPANPGTEVVIYGTAPKV